MSPLACVLECSTIGSMILLSVVVVITRIGVNKHLPPIETAESAARPAGPTPASAGLMVLVGCLAAAALTAAVWAVSPAE